MKVAYLIYRSLSNDFTPIRICFDESIARAAVHLLQYQYPRRKYYYDSVARDDFPGEQQKVEQP
jgi:hypothetical protein